MKDKELRRKFVALAQALGYGAGVVDDWPHHHFYADIVGPSQSTKNWKEAVAGLASDFGQLCAFLGVEFVSTKAVPSERIIRKTKKAKTPAPQTADGRRARRGRRKTR